MEKLIWVSFFAFCLACPAWGQAAKGRALPVEAYGRWGTLYNEGISATGQWLSYSVSYESGADTLFVRSRTGSPAYSVAGGYSGQIIGDTMFGCLSKEGVFSLTSLQGNSTWEVSDVMSYRVGGSGRRIVLFCRGSGPALSVQVRDPKGALLLAITGVTAYAISPDNAVLCYGVNDGWGKAMALDLERLTLPVVLCTAAKGKFTGFAFEPSGASVAFMHSAPQDSAAPELLHYRFSSRKLRRVRINCGTDGECAVGSLGVSGDGQRVFFTVPAPAQQGLPAAGARPAIWNAADKELYSFRSRYKGAMLPPRLRSWDLASGAVSPIAVDGAPYTKILGRGRFVLCYGDSRYRPAATRWPERDCYIYDTEYNTAMLLGKAVSGAPEHLQADSSGRYLLLYGDGRWRAYDLEKQHITVLAELLPQDARFGAWTDDGKGVLFYDELDIWHASLDGRVCRRLTDAKAAGRVYRLALASASASLQKGLLLSVHAADHTASGYTVYRDGRPLQDVVYEKGKRVSALRCPAQGYEAISYVTEDFRTPPALYSCYSGKKVAVAESNAHAKGYSWGKSELISYRDRRGNTLHGVLCYPFDYDPLKRYPMIVYIYERQNYMLEQYVNPSLQNGSGFNLTHYTGNGYFVLFPDIIYETGQPGNSAVDCVTSAVHEALRTAPVDEKNIGLIGHSFGGYEVNYIITQTGMFRTAVAGAGVADLVSAYLMEDRESNSAGMWRFESDQMRMGIPFFEDPYRYLMNSPVTYAAAIQTPLLQFAGQDDLQVNPSQSMEFHLALRRLKKENLLLLYPGEGHVFIKKDSQRDLSLKISGWFAHYLKGGPKPTWMEPR